MSLDRGVQNYLSAFQELGVELYANDGAPTADGPDTGALVVDTTNGVLYINTGTASSATWTIVGTQS